MNRLYKLRTHGFVEINDDIWFPNIEFNALMKINKLTGELQIVDKFPHYDIHCQWLYSTVYRVKDKLVFIPCASDEIAIYDIPTGKMDVTVLDRKILGEQKPNFASAYVYKQYVYMFPVRAKRMVRYDVEKNLVSYLENDLNSVIGNLPKNATCFYQQYEVVDKKIYIPFAELNAVGIFDIDDESFDIKYLNIKGGCATINYAEQYFYLTSWKEAKIYRWNKETGEIKTYTNFPKEFAGGELTFSFAFFMEDKLLLFPHFGNMVISFDIRSEKISEEQRIESSDEAAMFTYLAKKYDEYYCVLTSNMMFAHFRNHEKAILSDSWEQDNPGIKRTISNFLIKEGYYTVFSEEEETLREYIEVISNAEHTQVLDNSSVCGERIYRKVCLNKP